MQRSAVALNCSQHNLAVGLQVVCMLECDSLTVLGQKLEHKLFVVPQALASKLYSAWILHTNVNELSSHILRECRIT